MRTTTNKPAGAMFHPAHPGEVLGALYLAPLNLGVGEAAQKLGVTRKTLSALINGRQGVSPAMSLRLAKALDTTPQLWLNLQQQHDLWRAGQTTDLSGVAVLRRASGG